MERHRLKRGRAPRRYLDFDNVVYGIHAVREAMDAGEPLRALHVARDRRKDATLRDLLSRAQDASVRVHFEERAFFASLPFKAHQGVVAIALPFQYAGLEDVRPRSRDGAALFVVLDHLTDPHNVGAIVRTAECVGADAVILPERRSAGVNATVRKASAGAAARVPIVRIANVAQTIRRLKDWGVTTVGADAAGSALPMGDADFTGNVALVIGSEGHGLAPLVKRECDLLVRIPVCGQIASLNASVAAGVLLYEVVRQRSLTQAGTPSYTEEDEPRI